MRERKKRPIEERFWEKVDKKSESECWSWLGSKSHGYGNIRRGKGMMPAHKLSYELHKGAVGQKMQVCHSCDNPICVNPNHLWVGTALDNHRDMTKKKRNSPPPKGLRGKIIITDEMEKEIKNSYINVRGIYKNLSDKFGISASHISKIINNKRRKTT